MVEVSEKRDIKWMDQCLDNIYTDDEEMMGMDMDGDFYD